MFILLTIISSLTYKGGSRFNELNPYYSFTENYLSELGANSTYSGYSNNIPKIFFDIAVIFGSAGLTIFYHNLPFLFKKSEKRIHSLSIAASVIGILSSFMCMSVAFVPVDVFGLAHRICVYIFGCLVLPTQILFAIAIFLDKEYPNFYGWIYSLFSVVLAAYILMNIIIKYNAPYKQEVAKIVGQKIVILFNAINVIIQAYGTRRILNKKDELNESFESN